MIRTFVAVVIPYDIKILLKEQIHQLRKHGTSVKWVNDRSIHLTLKFLGDIESSQIETIVPVLENVFKEIESFSVEITGTGAFPNFKRPRIYWVGIEKGNQELAAMAKCVDNALEPLGFSKEDRPFRPHLTLGRVKSNHGINEVSQAVTQISIHQEFNADRIVFMKSDLQQSGAVYTPVHYFQLKGSSYGR